MAEQRSPGVKVVETLLPRDTGTVTNTPSRAVIAGYLQRGPLTPTVVGSWAEFRSVYGDWRENPQEPFSPYAHNQTVDGAYNYFLNNPRGGSSLTVLRVINEAKAVSSSLDVVDETATVTDPADKRMFTVSALAPGAWGNRLRVSVVPQPLRDDSSFYRGQVVNGQPVADQFSSQFGTQSLARFNLYVYVQQGPTGSAPPELVERYLDLSMNISERQYVGTVINTLSKLIRVTNVKENSALVPTEISMLSPQHLTNGDDGPPPTHDSFVDALTKLDDIPSSLTVCIPGVPDANIQAALVEYCTERGDSFAIVGAPDLPPTDDTQHGEGSAATWAQNFGSKSAYGAIYYPDIFIPDPTAGGTGIIRKTSCAGAVLGAFAANDFQSGVWHTPAGVSSYLRGVTQASRTLTQNQMNELNSSTAPVNVIRRVSSTGICIMGGRTLDQRMADRYVGIRRSLSYIHRRLKDLTEFALFENNGPDLWEEVNIRLGNFLGLYYQQGALRGAREPEAFYIVCDASNNTPATIQNGEMHVTVGVAVEYPAEFVIIKLTQSQGSVRVS